jgi:hypothetical protein
MANPDATVNQGNARPSYIGSNPIPLRGMFSG